MVSLITEGVSIRAASRLTGLDKNTIMALLRTVGDNCRTIFNARVRNIAPRYVQADEMWAFVFKKQRRLGTWPHPEWGDTYLWLALDSESKLIISYYVGKREAVDADRFISDLKNRTKGRFQLTTDGLSYYRDAVEEHFGGDIDFAQTLKTYKMFKNPSHGDFKIRGVVGVTTHRRIGEPDPDRISTSFMERGNLTVRMQLRRFTRCTNAFSKKLMGLKAAVNLYVAWYNFVRVHSTIRMTPAMQAGLTDHIWSIAEILPSGVA